MALPITDSFNQNTGSTQGITTYSANFTVLEGGMEVKSGNVGYFGGTTGTYNTTRNNSESFQADQYAQNKFTSVQISGGWYGGPAVRCQSGANSSYHVDANGSVYYLSKCLAGTQSTLAGPITFSAVAGDIIKITAEANGGNVDLKVWKALAASPTSFSQVGSTYTDSSSPITTAGYAGFFIYGSSSGDGPGEWTAGDINPITATSTSSRRKKRLIQPGSKPGPFGARLRTRRYSTPAALPTITGTLATTNADDTAAAAGTTTVTGTSATTNAADTSAASGTVWAQAASRRAKTLIHPGAGPYNLLRFKRTARHAVVSNAVTGTAAATNADDTAAAAGTTTILGTVAQTNGNDTVSAAGTTTVVGASATTNAADTVSAAGTTTVTGTTAQTNGNDTSAAAGTTTITGSAAVTNANDTLSAAGFLPTTGTVNVTNGNDTLSATGTGPAQGGGGGKRKIKSWDQRQRERLAEIEANKPKRDSVADKYGDLPATLKQAIRNAEPYKRLSPARVKAYDALRYNDDEEAMEAILALL